MLPTLGAFAAFANGSTAGGISLLLLSGLLVLLFSLWHEQIELVSSESYLFFSLSLFGLGSASKSILLP